MRLQRGTIVLVDLDPTRGHEQKGLRPGAIVSDPDVTEDQRFPMLCIVPITGTAGEGALYPALQPGSSGLRKRSFALIDQLRSIDKRRVRRAFGSVTPNELESIDGGLRLYLGLA
ncbi:MAG: type II toxin-antitoxin system PemK/MazF family toxin [Gemmatimonadetes bacterium]|nr:type II toxin-antitoxin system PemK/MazF family toxin [Gemmatimonadota bacterium]